jgi:tRNA G18 (ribose-2'-O)-methylase SpoU
MRGIADSLNISVSAAVIAYEARRQRDEKGDGGQIAI